MSYSQYKGRPRCHISQWTFDKNDTIKLSPVILKETPVDMIIGRDTIKKYKLFEKIPSQLSSDGVGRNGCIALHYYVHFFTNFLFRHSWDRKWGCWYKICTVHNSVCVMSNPLAKTWDSNSGSYLCMPLVLTTQPYKILYTDLVPTPSLSIPRVTKEKIRKKVDVVV